MAEHEWKDGQEVAYFNAYASIPQRMTVDRVTPSGRAIIGRAQFDKSGYQIGGGRFSRPRIAPWSDDHAKRLKTAQIEQVKEMLRHIYDIPSDVVREAVEIVLAKRSGGADAE